MSFQGKVVVVAGATGVVGSGAVRSYLDAGATVVGISRSADKLAKLKQQVKIGASEPFHGVVGDFNDEAAGEATLAQVRKALGGKAIDHFVSTLGFIVVEDVATATSLKTFRASLEDSLFNSFVAAKAFLPGMKSRAGATYTVVTGGFGHAVYAPNLWMATVKNAALTNLAQSLAAETANDAVRVNGFCIHVAVAPAGGDKNQIGMASEGDTLKLGKAFLGVANKAEKGQVVCITNWADAATWGAKA